MPEPSTTPPSPERSGLVIFLQIVLAILLPPLAAFLRVGFGGHFWLNILLTILGYVPGLVHAVWLVARR